MFKQDQINIVVYVNMLLHIYVGMLLKMLLPRFSFYIYINQVKMLNEDNPR